MRKTLSVVALFSLALVPSALAHVEPSPEKVPAGSVSRITLSVEGEEKVPAVRLTVQVAPGVTDVVPHPGGGWKPSVHGRIITWFGGKIPNGDEGKFSFTARMPSKPGVLVFPSLVTYEDGNVVHWIGAEASDTPAPRVTLTASQQATPPPPPTTTTTTTTFSDPAANDDSSDSSNWIWIFVVAAILASLAAILLVRRRRT